MSKHNDLIVEAHNAKLESAIKDDQQMTDCPDCWGVGELMAFVICPTCNGVGYIPENQS